MTSPHRFDQPNSTWNTAVETGKHGDPFCCRTEWQLAFHEAFAPNRDLCITQQEGSLNAFALRRTKNSGTLFEPIESSWMFGCPLLGPNAIPMLSELLDSHPTASVLLSGMDIDDSRTEQILHTFGYRYEIAHVDATTACRASLDGGLDGYLSRRSAKHRRGMRNASRRIRESGVSFERHAPSTQAEADAVYARIIAIEERSWKGIGKCGMNKPPSLQFYLGMLRRMATSACGRVMFARHNDTDVGFIFGGLCGPNAKGNTYRGQQFSFADDWRRASLGNVLQFEQLSWLCEEQVARYDMGPVMDYKHHWTEIKARIDAIAMRPN